MSGRGETERKVARPIKETTMAAEYRLFRECAEVCSTGETVVRRDLLGMYDSHEKAWHATRTFSKHGEFVFDIEQSIARDADED
jgi:hypothetical protein